MIKKVAIGFDIKVTWLAISKMYNPIAQQHGTTISMAFVLLMINPEKGSRATKIAPLMGMEPRSLTRLLKKLEEQGYTRREPDPEDKRSVRIFLTEKGQKSAAIALNYVSKFNEKLRDEIPAKKLKIFFDVLEDIHNVIKHTKFETRNGQAARLEKSY